MSSTELKNNNKNRELSLCLFNDYSEDQRKYSFVNGLGWDRNSARPMILFRFDRRQRPHHYLVMPMGHRHSFFCSEAAHSEEDEHKCTSVGWPRKLISHANPVFMPLWMTRIIMERMAIRTKRNRSRMRILTAFCNANKLELVESSWDMLWIKLMTTI